MKISQGLRAILVLSPLLLLCACGGKVILMADVNPELTVPASPILVDTSVSLSEFPLRATDGNVKELLVFCIHSGPAWALAAGSGSDGEATGILYLRPTPLHAGRHSGSKRISPELIPG